MYVHKNSGATLSNAEFEKLPDGRIKSKYSKVAEAPKESKPAPKKTGDSKS